MNALIILAMSACYAMIFLDMSGVAVILPKLQQNLNLTNNSLQWVMNSYMLTTAICLLPGGRLGDKFGTRKIFLLGIVIFIVGSILCALSTNELSIILGRIIQGLGASMIMPTVVILIQRCFPDNQYGKAFGTILIFSNLVYAIGPFLGGLLTEYFSWHSIFWINLPIGLVSLFLSMKFIPQDESNIKPIPFDFVGTFIFMVAISSLVTVLMQGGVWGWGDYKSITLFILSFITLIAFVIHQQKIFHPLLDIKLFHNKLFITANIIMCCGYMSFAAVLFWPLWLHHAFNLSPLMLGIAMIPATFPTVFMPLISGHWRDRSGPRPTILLGSWITAAGLIWIFFTANSTNYWLIFPGILAYGFGLPTFIPACVMVIMTSVAPEHKGMASGVFTTLRNVFLSLGFAVISLVITASEKHYESATGTNYVKGFSYGMLVVGCVVLFAALLVTFYIPKKIPTKN